MSLDSLDDGRDIGEVADCYIEIVCPSASSLRFYAAYPTGDRASTSLSPLHGLSAKRTLHSDLGQF